MSDSRPKLRRTTAVRSEYPNRIQSRVVAVVPGSSRPMVGSEMSTILVSIAAIRVARVVLERTFHLYCIGGPAARRAQRRGGRQGRVVWEPSRDERDNLAPGRPYPSGGGSEW